jgi:hypothetical protein
MLGQGLQLLGPLEKFLGGGNARIIAQLCPISG